MVAGLLTAALLSFLLPATALAGPHGSLINRHHELARRAGANMQLYQRGPNARLTFYNTETGSPGSCGTFLSNTAFTVAMNSVQMNPGWCGRTITITCNGKSTTATIEDACPGCSNNGLDLTPALFSFFADQSVGVLTCDWEFLSAAPSPTPPPPPPPPPPSPSPTPPPPPPPSPSPPPSPPPPPPPPPPPSSSPPPPPPPSPSPSHSPLPPPPPVSSSSPPPSTSTQASSSIQSSVSPTSTPTGTNTSASTNTNTSGKPASASSNPVPTTPPASSSNYLSSPASGLAEPTGSVTQGTVNNIDDLNHVLITMGGLAAAAHGG